MGSNFIAPSGYVDLDNDCEFSLDLKSTRSRESVDPKEDLAFYFNTYISPKYGLGNLNVSNVASFMKDLDMNWTKLTPDLKDKVLDIMVDGIFQTGDYDFKAKLSQKIGAKLPDVSGNSASAPDYTSSAMGSKSNFENSKSTFGSKNSSLINSVPFIVGGVIIILLIFYYTKQRPVATSHFSRF